MQYQFPCDGAAADLNRVPSSYSGTAGVAGIRMLQLWVTRQLGSPGRLARLRQGLTAESVGSARALTVGALAAAVLAAACAGGDGSAGDDPTPAATPSPVPTEVPTASPVPEDTPTPAATETPAEEDQTETADAEDEPQVDVLFDYLQAVGLLNAGMYKEAVGRYSVVLRIHPDLHLAYRGRALAYYNEELIDLAIEDLDRAIEIKPDYAEALRDRGVLLSNEGRYGEARRDLEAAAQIYREKGDIVAMSEALTRLEHLPQ